MRVESPIGHFWYRNNLVQRRKNEIQRIQKHFVQFTNERDTGSNKDAWARKYINVDMSTGEIFFMNMVNKHS